MTLGGHRIGQQPWDLAEHADISAWSRKGITTGPGSFRDDDGALTWTGVMNGRCLLSGSSFLFAAGILPSRADGAVTVTGWCQLRVASSFLL